MLIRYLLLIVFLTLPIGSNAQNSITDSLKKNLDEAIANNVDSLNLSRAYFKLGKHLSYIDIIESNKYLDRALLLAMGLKNSKAIAIISNIIAANYSAISQNQKAIKTYQICYKLFMKLKEYNHAADILTNIEKSYVDLGEYTKALQTGLRALELKVNSKDSTNIAFYYSSVGIIYDLLNNPLKHKEYILKAYKLSQIEKYANFTTKTEILNELGRVFENDNKNNKAINTYEKLYKLCKEKNRLSGVSTALINISILKYKLGLYKEAIKAAEEAYKISHKLGRQYGICSSANRLAKGYIKEKEYKKAKKYLHEALEISNKKNIPEELQQTYHNLYLLHKKEKKFAKALSYYEKYAEIRDTLSSQNIHKTILEMDTKYQTLQKDKAIESLNNEKKIQSTELRQRNIILFSLIIFIILSSITLYIFYKRKREKLLYENVKTELKMLRAQLNPHFIFNSLGAIQNFILNNNAILGADYLSDFSKLMRLILNSSREEKISIADEITLLKNYLNLEKLRYNNIFSFKINTDIKVDAEGIYIPPMLIQPFVENAVKHGVTKTDNGIITINIKEEENRVLTIEIWDNGQGFYLSANEADNHHKSQAIKITKQRIKNLNTKNENYIKFYISSEKEIGTKIKFEILL